ncbi:MULTISPECIES: pyrimidine reductase family protein [unclassified Leucobacter]|uniref:pyrimidine reductase family protein n=1 Tax=unclassified Leucobacter TaxID=2621730 RepID=UPI00165E1F41|nr:MULTISPECIES: pyrimidine reductase family protein [unclassified Leucobacter]MBC9927872.1 pyrimidine reductase family protein [Leucobacter sp. cx-169]
MTPALTREELFAAYALAGRDEPSIRVNFVSSADGALTVDGHSGGLGGVTDRRLMQVLRAMSDAILVGAGTVRSEGYAGVRPGARDAAWRADRGLEAVPPIVIVSGDLALDPGLGVFTEAAARPIVVTHSASPVEQRRALDPVADVLVCDPGASGRVDLSNARDQLAARGLTQLLSEGGPHLFGALLEANLVDELCLTVSPHLVGGSSGRILQGAGEAARPYVLAHALTDDEGFVFLRYTR